MTYCTPFLLSLGMSKSRMSLVWIAGPLSGLVTQPIVGMKSDKSRSRYGRRRPYMMAGTVAVFVCYLVLGWTQEIVAFFVGEAELVCRRRIDVYGDVGGYWTVLNADEGCSNASVPFCSLWAISTCWIS